MRKTLILLAGVLSAIFLIMPAKAQPFVCDPVDQESVLIKGVAENPSLLMKELDGAPLQRFWANMRDGKFMLGEVQIDKVYIFYSEHHPEWVYVYFLNEGCIHDVKFTFKNIVERLMQ